ncbi:MAG: bifunctional diaminohydroxyphosphoribosylaminopyrimidine deaminase/5-amino-6-(5-phosphoribosylamino)uracil reductase RibD [Acidobacteria bacterium]|nr:bifunctional diaminohydroxyphosphoribosylaminopyrimidine deaminase/5-amino-6-(5-phosphoribosylamino)uracil reductase RibD [Acidobacteriota bacterium]
MASKITEADEQRLRECLDLAATAKGQTSPNPMVGALVVTRDGTVVGRGYHRRCGEPHAERHALEQAGQQARDATLYVNVEPCCHQGQTPPCTDAVIEAGVTRVVACHVDPDERVAGRGFAALEEAGIDVAAGGLVDDAVALNAGYLTVKTEGRVCVTGKAALSLDARLATRLRQSQWITGPESRQYAHEVRASHDVVMVGIGTVLADDPSLDARTGDATRPRYRAVVDTKLRTPPTAKVFEVEQGDVVIITTDAAPPARVTQLEDAGAQILVTGVDAHGRVDLREALRKLTGLGVSTCLVEGGGALLTTAFDAGIIDRVVLFYAPILIGGRAAPQLWGGEGTAELGAAPRLMRPEHRQFGADRVIEGYLRLPRPGR